MNNFIKKKIVLFLLPVKYIIISVIDVKYTKNSRNKDKLDTLFG